MIIKTFAGGSLGTNCYILQENDKIALIDFVPEIENYINENNLIIDSILLTHSHFDHFEKLWDFQKNHNFKLIISSKIKKNINNNFFNLSMFVNPVNQNPKIDLNNAITIENNSILEILGQKIKMIETPGHSDDSIIYIIDGLKSVFSGDTLFYESVGRTDFPNSNHKKMIDSIKNLFSLYGDDYTVYPGHGMKTSIEHEKKYNAFIK